MNFSKCFVRGLEIAEQYYDRLWTAIVDEKDETKQQQLADRYIEEMMEIYQMDPVSGGEIQPRHWDFKHAYRTMCESDQYVSQNEYVNALSKIDVPHDIDSGSPRCGWPGIPFQPGPRACAKGEDIRAGERGSLPMGRS